MFEYLPIVVIIVSNGIDLDKSDVAEEVWYVRITCQDHNVEDMEGSSVKHKESQAVIKQEAIT
jgi:hypothetical protein